ncbi:MAG: CpaD family pilus assembly lipoprotein [Parvibaculaceae bacterium]
MSKTGWLKIMVLGGLALGAAACSSTEPDSEDFYTPVAHYERHPIVVTKSGAHVQGCGYWPEDLTKTSRNEQYENFGCAQQNNIAAMVANPRDLQRPRKQTPADATRRSKVFDNYRQGEATAAAEEERQKVLISNVGGGG